MRSIEIRRHCLTKKGEARGQGSHLSREGVFQAWRIGEEIGPFDWVLTSQIPRTLETALAMGFAVDEQIDALGEISAPVWEEIGHQERWSWDKPFAVFADLMARGGATAQMGRNQREIWSKALESVPPNGKVLVISHGRIIESGLVNCFNDDDFAAWGSPFHHGEGVKMDYETGRFYNLEFLRLA